VLLQIQVFWHVTPCSVVTLTDCSNDRRGFTSKDKTVKTIFILAHFDPEDEGIKLLRNVGTI